MSGLLFLFVGLSSPTSDQTLICHILDSLALMRYLERCYSAHSDSYWWNILSPHSTMIHWNSILSRVRTQHWVGYQGGDGGYWPLVWAWQKGIFTLNFDHFEGSQRHCQKGWPRVRVVPPGVDIWGAGVVIGLSRPGSSSGSRSWVVRSSRRSTLTSAAGWVWSSPGWLRLSNNNKSSRLLHLFISTFIYIIAKFYELQRLSSSGWSSRTSASACCKVDRSVAPEIF